MTKKNSSKMLLKNPHEGPSTENQKPSLKPKKNSFKKPLKDSHEEPSKENQKPKYNSSKKLLKNSHESPSSTGKPSLKRKKMGSEIDDIFATKKKSLENDKKKASTNEKPRKVSSSVKVKSNGKTGMVRDGDKKSRSFNEHELGNPTSRSRKRTADGLTLYTEEELGFGKSDAGGTPLCPFDCDCCF